MGKVTGTASNFLRRIIGFASAALVSGVMIPSPSIAEEIVVVGNFSAGSLMDWMEKVFKDNTRYEIVDSSVGRVLKADSRASASGLFREIEIDLTKTPCLNWSWKVDGILEGLDETTKNGDDYPARVYVVFSGGLFFWKTRALNYVWSNARPKGSAWPNAYTDRSVIIAAESGPDNIGQWVHHSRNIRDDYKRLVGEDITTVDAVAIMTDTDGSERVASAYYGDVRFTSSCE